MRRDLFLAGVRQALATAHLPGPGQAPPFPPDLPERDLVDLFRHRAGSAAATVVGPLEPAAIPGAVVDLASGARNFIAWEELPVPGVIEALVGGGLRRLPTSVGRTPARRLADNAGYAEVDLGVTGADAALAESGSIVVRSGPGRPRMASLVAEAHIALVRVGELHRSLSHYLARDEGMAGSSNVAVITGPSKTADIEQTITVGVHGPRRLDIVLVGP